MKCKTLLIACLFGLGSAQALAVSKLPPQIPVHASSGRVTLDLRPLLAETNDVEITRVSVCRRVGSHCQETLWRIELPPGWRAGEIEVFCLAGEPGNWMLLDEATCLARRNAEERQGEKP